LKALAVERPERITVRIAGLVSYFLLPDFDKQVASCENIVVSGPYDWPEGLRDAYRDLDLVWAQELSWKGKNSDWLIPNRVYEASYFGVPSLSVGDTETSRIVRARGIGYVLHEESVGALTEFIDKLDVCGLDELRSRILAMPATDFVAGPADTAALLEAVERARYEGHPL
jgi:succinoglycan biosynthesis protein ExoL